MRELQTRNLGTTAILLLSCNFCFAQIVVTGQVTDHLDKPLSGVNVIVLAKEDSAFIEGTLTDKAGHFTLKEIHIGNHLLSITNVGFETVTQAINMSGNATVHNVGVIVLQPVINHLSAVTVVARKPLFETKIDRMVINVKNSITSVGGSVLDVLQKSPGVIVDRQSGSIQMAGKSGVNVMINGKMNYMPADALVQLLSGMSANNVERIELISTPPAKYDAGGNAGYINIILVASPDLGFNGSYSITAAAFNGSAPAADFNFNHRTRKGNLFGGVAALRNAGNFSTNLLNYRRFIHQGNQTELTTLNLRDPVQLNRSIRVGYDYKLSPKTIIGVLTSGYINRWSMDANNSMSKLYNGTVDTSITIKNDEVNQWKNRMGNFNLQHQINSTNELTFNIDYLIYDNDNPNNYYNQYFHPAAQLVKQVNNRSGKLTSIKILPVQSDYKFKLRNMNFETGIKAVRSKFTNDISVEDQYQNSWVENPDFTALYFLKEDIGAAYISMETGSAHTSFKAGMRYEYTDVNLSTLTQKDIVDRKYGRWFPTVYFSQKTGENTRINISYNKRINRPAFTALAPFTIFTDPFSFITGNPALQPSITDIAKVDFTIGRTFLSVSYSYEKDPIAGFQAEADASTNQQILTTRNLNSNSGFDLMAAVPYTFTRWWNMQFNLTGSWRRINGMYQQKMITIENANIGISGFHGFTLPYNWGAELSGFYQSPSAFGIMKMNAMGALNAAIQKKFPDHSSSLKFGVDDMLSSMIWQSEFDTNDYATTARMQITRRMFKITYSKSFGNNQLKANRKRITASEEERKRISN